MKPETDNWQIGVCSWSLSNDLELLERLREVASIDYIHLEIRPERGDENTRFIKSIISQGWSISCGMVSFEQEDYSTFQTIARSGGIVPNQYWDINSRKIKQAIDILADIGVEYLSFHFGFIDESDEVFRQKVLMLADYADKNSIKLLMETGQENSKALVRFLDKLSHTAVAVNFDPANMILYGSGNPCEDMLLLQPWIKHIHIKDAIYSDKAGKWGKEVLWGQGDVKSNVFLDLLTKIKYNGVLCIERESGSRRFEDIVDAITSIRNANSKRQ